MSGANYMLCDNCCSKMIYVGEDDSAFAWCEKCVDQLRTQLDQHRWIPVAERLPEAKGVYLACIKNGNYPSFVSTVLHYGKDKAWASPNNVTHWKPTLLPTEGENDE